ncbi:MAG: class I SAM-dependent methyltransferase [Burkholderiales bacterium]
MISREVSRTALEVAYMRAAHQILDSKPLLFEDAFAVQILGKDAPRKIREATAHYQTPVARALRSRVALRSRYAEDQLLSAIQRGISQYVIVGAGFDTFSLRQPKWANDLLIVEVDHPGTQSHKLSLLDEAGLSVRDNVKFAEIDFESETLEEGLLRNGISIARNTFFSWLGVTMYLTEEAIDATLRSMSKFPAGSQVVLTFAEPSTSSPVAKAIAARIAEHVESIGEPFVSYFEPEALRSMLVSAGFASVELLSADEAHRRYFVHGHADLPPPKRIGLASAIR